MPIAGGGFNDKTNFPLCPQCEQQKLHQSFMYSSHDFVWYCSLCLKTYSQDELEKERAVKQIMERNKDFVAKQKQKVVAEQKMTDKYAKMREKFGANFTLDNAKDFLTYMNEMSSWNDPFDLAFEDKKKNKYLENCLNCSSKLYQVIAGTRNWGDTYKWNLQCPKCGIIYDTNIQNKYLSGEDMTTVTVEATHGGEIFEIQFQIRRRGQFKEEIEPILGIIKSMVPASDRNYDDKTKKWEISKNYWPSIKMIMQNMGNYVLETPQVQGTKFMPEPTKEYAESFFYEQASSTSAPAKSTVTEQLGKILGIVILNQTPTELKALYRKKALELHPDRNPAGAKQMSELNYLWALFNA